MLTKRLHFTAICHETAGTVFQGKREYLPGNLRKDNSELVPGLPVPELSRVFLFRCCISSFLPPESPAAALARLFAPGTALPLRAARRVPADSRYQAEPQSSRQSCHRYKKARLLCR